MTYQIWVRFQMNFRTGKSFYVNGALLLCPVLCDFTNVWKVMVGLNGSYTNTQACP